MSYRNSLVKEESHDVVMVAAYWSDRLAYRNYFLSLKREEQLLKRMDRMCGDSNYYA